ncbi:hypothetical protein Noda2021_09290 [Candidatus Dependentiae bacterium Noda2021]|nr:hypothetical protein Noda2021_09290 [Candidatus Dependentiae bacterium Noda2021]
MNTWQRATMQASVKRSHEVKKRAEKVDNESDVAGIASDLGNAFKDGQRPSDAST